MSTPRRIAADETIILATHNAGKVREIGALLAPYRITVIAAGDIGLPEPEETGLSFVANAELKALAAARAAGKPALADDSGLAVDALDGAPGIYSARWAGPAKDFAAAMTEVERRVSASGRAERGAAFFCALTLAWPDGHCETVLGRIDGTLTFPPRGAGGFGYDPIFVPTGHEITFGEMDPAEKHAISHRADAFRQLVARCFS